MSRWWKSHGRAALCWTLCSAFESFFLNLRTALFIPQGPGRFNMPVNLELHTDNKALCAAVSLCLLWATPAQLFPLHAKDHSNMSAGWSQSEQKQGEEKWGRRCIRALTVTRGFDLFVSIRGPSFSLCLGPLTARLLLLCLISPSICIVYLQRKH